MYQKLYNIDRDLYEQNHKELFHKHIILKVCYLISCIQYALLEIYFAISLRKQLSTSSSQVKIVAMKLQRSKRQIIEFQRVHLLEEKN